MATRKSWIEKAMRNNNIVIIITVLLMAIGVVALKKMPRNEFPQFTIRQGVIVGIYPGATSAEVEAQLTRTVENYIFGYKEIKKAKTYSYSREGIMYIFVELNDDVKNADQFWSKLKHGLDELKPQLPAGVLALVANSEYGDTSALLITLSSDTKSFKDLEGQLKKLESECRKIPATSKIRHYGLQKEKIYVKVKPEMLNAYNIKSFSLMGAYQLNGMVSYASELDDGKNTLAVHLPRNYQSEKDLADQIVYTDPMNHVVRLKDVATIERRYSDPENYISQNGKKTVLLSLEMEAGNNIVEYGKEVDKAINAFQNQCPKGIEIAKISELPKYVNDSVTNFMEEFFIAIVAVILVTMLLLPLRIASVAGITVPISVLITLGILYFLGVELNTVSLASLILVLGMIVDNSIVIIDNHVEKVDHGGSPWHAAILSAQELVVPIITATLAICCAYFPLNIFLPGTAGEFVSPLAVVVSIALAVSVAVALLIVPYLNFVFIKKGLENPKRTRKTFLDILQKFFDRSLEKAFQYPKTVITIAMVIIVAGVIVFKTTDQQLFPELERNQFAVEVYLPTGASLENTGKVIDSLENALQRDPRITNVTSFVGTSSPRFHTVYAPNMPAPNYGQLLVNTVSDKATREVVNEYGKTYSDRFANAHINWKILAISIAKNPIEIRISSDSIQDIRNTEEKINDILKQRNDLTWIRTDWDQKRQGISVNLNNDKANRLGLSKTYVAASLMTAIDGLPLTTIWEDDYPVQVMLSQENHGEKSTRLLADQLITSPVSISATPLRSIATFTPEWSEGNIVRRNGIRTLTIQVNNDTKITASRIFNEIRPQVDALKLPAGTTISYGGEYEGQVEVFIPMTIALGLSIVLIFFIILFQFKKEKLTLLIMLTMLLGFPGAAFGLKLAGYPFSLTAFIGISSICGMVVRNGIILIDYARDLHENKHLTVFESALAAGKRRMRPIFLTSAAASVGVIPMIISRSSLWGPVGTVICFGLLLAMVLTLYVLPVLYSLVYSDRPPRKGFWSLPGSRIILVISLVAGSGQVARSQNTGLSLDSCKSLAMYNNYKIRQAAGEVKQSIQVKKDAFTKYFPNVSAGFMGMKTTDYLVKATTPQMNLPVYDGNPMSLLNPTLFAYVPPISLNLVDYINMGYVMAAQPVFAGGRIYNGNRLARTGLEINQHKESLTKTEVLVKTEELYWNLTSLNEKMATLEAYRLLLDTLNHDVSSALRAGLVQRTDILKVQLKQNELEIKRIQLTDAIALCKMALCLHIGIPCDSNLVLTDKVPDAEDPGYLFVDSESAVKNRNEYHILEKAVRAEELQKKIRLGEYLPRMAVGVAGVYNDMMDKTDEFGIAFATVSVPISDWWGGAHTLKESALKIENAQLRLEETADFLSLQVNHARNDLYEMYFRTAMARKSLDQATENLGVTKANYKAGVASMADLLEAEAVHQEAIDNQIESQCNYHIKKACYLESINQYPTANP